TMRPSSRAGAPRRAAASAPASGAPGALAGEGGRSDLTAVTPAASRTSARTGLTRLDLTASLPLDGGGRPARAVEDHPVHAPHLVRDPARDARDQARGQPGPVRRHAVLAVHRPQRDHLLVRPLVALDPDGLEREQHREGLPGAVVPAGAPQLLD